MLDRRRFLQLVGMGVGAGLMAGSGGSLLDHLLLGHDPSAWAAGPIGAHDGVLVVIGMFGGNDGLNTVVPFDDPLYYQQHGGLAIPAGQTLPIARGLGLNPALTELKRWWDAGQLAVVQGVGYPNADFSHFNSMAYWMAGQVGGIPSTGWLGRWLDGYLGGGRDLFAAAEVGYSVPLHLIGANQRGTVVPTSKPGFGTGTDSSDLQMYQAMRNMRTAAHGPWHAAVGQAFVDQLDLAATLAGHYPADDALPDSEIVAGLEIAARMINANLGFRVLTVGFGDFDSHANQPEMHTARMQELNDGARPLLRSAQPGVVEPRHRHDVLRVRAHELGQRWPGHRPRIVGAALRARSERQGRSVRRAADAVRAGPLGADGLHTSTSARTTRRSSTAGWAAGRPRCSAARSRTSGCSPARPARARTDRRRRHRRSSRRRAASCPSARSGWSTRATARAACSTGRSGRASRCACRSPVSARSLPPRPRWPST